MAMEKLDLTKPYVNVGPYTIQGWNFFGLPDHIGDEGFGWAKHFRGRLRFIAGELGLLFDEARSGTQKGYGHGRETMTLVNRDGSLIFQMTHVNHCDGPGFACSYSHGPWYKYGQYTSGAAADPKLLEAVHLKQQLAERFQF